MVAKIIMQKHKLIKPIIVGSLALFAIWFYFIRFDMTDCQQNIKQQLQFIKPLSNWIEVVCTPAGQVIRSNINYNWHFKGSDNVYLDKNGDVSSYKQQGEYLNGAKYHSFSEKKARTYVITNYNNFLSELLGEKAQYKDIYTLRLFGNLNFIYDLTIYVENGHPVWLRICQNYCFRKKELLVRIELKEEL